MDKVRKPSNSVCYTPSSEPYRIYLKKCIYIVPLSSTHLWLRCSNFFNPSEKNSFGCAANRNIGSRKCQRLISIPTYSQHTSGIHTPLGNSDILRHNFGRVIAQAVSRRLPTVVARVRAQVRSCGIYGGQGSTGAGFLRVLRLPLPILIPPTAPHSSSIIRCWYNRPVSGRRTKWTQSHPTPN
jgi:hypothetical protein